jgi:predicted metal-dependent hydrolase
MSSLGDTINEVWRKAYGEDVVAYESEYALCAIVVSLATDRAAWISNAKAYQKENNRLEQIISELQNKENK